jgi:putative transposase
MLFRNKYRIEPARLPGWDYSARGNYFVTVCTNDRSPVFGEIEGNRMIINNFGRIVHEEWIRTFEIRRQLLQDEFIVMPNHFHAIVRIAVSQNSGINAGGPGGSVGFVGFVETPCHGVSTDTNTNITPSKNHYPSEWKSGVLGAIIGQFKQQVTKRIRTNGLPGFCWQSRFHDHIIRNDQELFRIRQYIKNNPANWGKDKFNTADDTALHEDSPEYEKEDWMIVA